MLRCSELRTGTLSECVQVEVASDDDIVRDEVQDFDNATDNRHTVNDTGNECTSRCNSDSVCHQLSVCGLVHDPDFLTTAVLALSRAEVFDDSRNHILVLYGCRDGLDVGGVQVYPRTCGCRICCRSFSLYQTGNDTERHTCAGSVQDCLVECKTDCLSDCSQEFGCEVDIGIFEVRIANCEVTADLPAVQLHIVECEAEFIQICTAVCPNCFRNVSHDNGTTFASDLTNENVLVQLGVILDVLTNESEEDFRNEQTNVGQRTLLFDTLTDLCEECLYILTSEHCITFLSVHFEKSLIHDFDFLSLFFRLFFFRSRFRFSLTFLFGFSLFQFVLEVSDFAIQLRCCFLVLFLLSFELFDCFFDDLLLFFGRFSRFLDRLCKFGFSLFEFFLLRKKSVLFFVLLVDLGAEHQCFKHLCFLLSASPACLSSTLPHDASSLRHAVRFLRRCWSPHKPGMCNSSLRKGSRL